MRRQRAEAGESCCGRLCHEHSGDQTTVTWSMTGRQKFIAKAFCLFVNMDKMLGGEFEKGLAQLKVVSEASQKQGGEA